MTIPKAKFSAEETQLKNLRELLSSGEAVEMGTDGSLGAVSKADKKSQTEKAKTIPKGVTSADTVGELMARMRGETAADNEDDIADARADDNFEKAKVIPKGVTSAPSQWYETNVELYNAEVMAMRQEFNNPSLQPKFLDDGRMFWQIKCKPNLGKGYNTLTYKLLLVYDSTHPQQSYGTSVKAYLEEPNLNFLQAMVNELKSVQPKNIPHTLTDKQNFRYLCTVGSNDTSADAKIGITSAVTSFRFALRWLTVFELGIRDPKTWALFQQHGKI